MNLKFLLAKKAEIAQEIAGIVASGEAEGMLSDEAMENVKRLKASLDKVKTQIELLQGVEVEASVEPTPAVAASRVYASNNIPALRGKEKFDSLGEFMQAAMFNPEDPRLEYRSEQSMGVGSKGGFLIPSQFMSEVKSMEPTASLVRPRATIIPAGTPPDAEITIPALDQEPTEAGANQVYAGVTVSKVEEGGTKSVTDANFRLIRLKPSEFAARIPMTDKSLRNAPAIGTWAETLLRKAVLGAEDREYLVGNGVGGPEGATVAGGAYVVARQTSNQIDIEDIKEIYSRFVGLESNAVWVASRSAFRQLLNITGDGGGDTNIIAFDKSTSTVSIYGIPVIRHDRVSALGTQGDFGLYDFSAYLIKDGSGPIVETGFATGQWEANKRSVKITWNFDGRMWLTKPYRDEEDFESSPIVVLGDAAGS